MAHEHFQSCIEACNACADACDHCAAACLAEADVQSLSACIGINIDCGAMCRLMAGCLARGSEAIDVVADACAQLCDLCGEECGRHTLDHCLECADACRRCADECRLVMTATQPEMAAGTSAGAAPH